MTTQTTRTGRTGPTAPRRRDGRPVPRWARVAAAAVPFTTLPSGLWRLALVLGVPLGVQVDGQDLQVHGGEAVYVVCLSVVIEALALLTLGLVRPWGEYVPRWMPVLGGRRIPPFAAIVPAMAGAVVVQAVWTYAFRDPTLPSFEFAGDGAKALLIACYAPLLLWGPLLAAVTVAYYRRRCRG